MAPIEPATAATAAFLALHLVAERRGAPALRALGKLGASATFVALAVALGTHGRFRGAILAGLLLSAVGDGLLLSSRKSLFLGGLVAFLLAHVAYVVAFAAVSRPSASAALLVAAASGAALLWLWPHAGELRAPVAAYCLVIGAMVWLALGVDQPAIRAGALLFWVSDLAVARDRFVRPSFANRLVGLPLYFAAQLLIASAAG
jgi:uncharacterized membrane protein YhhN